MRIIFLFLMVMLSVLQGRGQHQNNTVMPSADGLQLGRPGQVPINEHTGTGSLSVPLYTVSAKLVSIPVSLTGNLGAVPVSQMATDVGLGWGLNAGGLITRRVRGLPDDRGGILSIGETSTKCHVARQMHEDRAAGTLDKDDIYDKTHSDPDIYKEKDVTSDEYYFNVNGVSGKFYFDENCEIVTSGLDDIIIEYELDTSSKFTNDFSGSFKDDEWSLLSSFVITTTDGTKYYFEKRSWTQMYVSEKRNVRWEGENLSYKYPIPTFPFIEVETTEKKDLLFYCEDDGSKYHYLCKDEMGHHDDFKEVEFVPSSWHLTRVVNNFGQLAATYEYDGEYTEEVGISDMSNYPNVGDVRTGLNKPRGKGCGTMDIVYFKAVNYNQRIRKIHWPVSHILSIGNYIRFVYDSEVRKDIAYDPDRIGNPNGFTRARRLKQVEYYNSVESKVAYTVLRHSYFDDGFAGEEEVYKKYRRRLWLTEVQAYQTTGATTELPPYKFFYNQPGLLPERYSVDIDVWGYHRISEYNHLLTNVYFYPGDPNARGAFSLYPRSGMTGPEIHLDYLNGRHENDGSELRNGTLWKVKYPAGGEQIFIYKENEFTLYGDTHKGAGLRIHGIKSIGGATPDSYVSYDYAGGKIYSTPRHASMDLSLMDLSNRRTEMLVVYYGRNLSGFSVPSMVGYEEVTKQLWGGGGFVKSYYSLPIHEETDSYSETANGATLEYNLPEVETLPHEIDDYPYIVRIYPFPEPTNVEHFNGRVLKTEILDKNGGLVSSSETQYEVFKVEKIYGVKGYWYKAWHGSVVLADHWSLGFSITNCADVRPVHTISKYVGQNGQQMVTETDILYGPHHKLPTEQRFTHSNGLEVVSKTWYPEDIYGNEQYGEGTALEKLIADNRVYAPIKTTQSIGGVENHATYTRYKTVLNSSPDGYVPIVYPNEYRVKEEDSWRWIKSTSYQSYEGNITGSRDFYFPSVHYAYHDNLLLFKKYGDWQWDYQYDNNRRVEWASNKDGLVTEFDSDMLGTFKEVSKRGGNLIYSEGINYGTSYNYKTFGTQYSDAAADEGLIFFDGFGREFYKILKYKGADGGHQYFRKTYDDAGRLIRETYLQGNTVTYGYDDSPLNRVVSEDLPGEGSRSYEHNVNAEAITVPGGYSYAVGTLKETVFHDENGKVSKSYEDKLGNTILTINTGGGKTYYQYDAYNRLVGVIPPGGGGKTDPVSYEYSYDCHDRLIEKRIPGGAPIKYYYDKNDQMVGMQDGKMRAEGKTLMYSYDSYGRQTATFWGSPSLESGSEGCGHYATPAGGSGQVLVSTIYHTQFKNQPQTQVVAVLGDLDPGDRSSLTYTYVYDNWGRGSAVTKDHLIDNVNSSTVSQLNMADLPTHTVYQGPGGTLDEGFEYDQANRVKYILHDDQRIIHQGYTNNGQLALKRLGYTGQTNAGDGPEYLQRINYGYTSRGWMDRMNTLPTEELLPLPECGGGPDIHISGRGECGDSVGVNELVDILRINEDVNINCYSLCEIDSLCQQYIIGAEENEGITGITAIYDADGNLVPLDYPYTVQTIGTVTSLYNASGQSLKEDLEAYLTAQGYVFDEVVVTIGPAGLYLTHFIVWEKTNFHVGRVVVTRGPFLTDYYPERYNCTPLYPEDNYGVDSLQNPTPLQQDHLNMMAATDIYNLKYPVTLYALEYNDGVTQLVLDSELLIELEDHASVGDTSNGGGGGPSIVDVDCKKIYKKHDVQEIVYGGVEYEMTLEEFLEVRNYRYGLQQSPPTEGSVGYEDLMAALDGDPGSTGGGDPGDPRPRDMDEDCICTYVDTYHPNGVTDLLDYTSLDVCDCCDPSDPICDHLLQEFGGSATQSYVTDGVSWVMVDADSADYVRGQAAWVMDELDNILDEKAEIVDFYVTVVLKNSDCRKSVEFALSEPGVGGPVNVMLDVGTTSVSFHGSTDAFSVTLKPQELPKRDEIKDWMVQMGVHGCDTLSIDGIEIYIKYKIPCDGDEEVDICDHDGPYCSDAQAQAQAEAMEEIRKQREHPNFKAEIDYPTQIHRVRLCDGTETYLFDFEIDLLTPRWQVLQTIDLSGPNTKVEVNKEDGGPVKKKKVAKDDEDSYDLFGMDLVYDPVGNVKTLRWGTRNGALMEYGYDYEDHYWMTDANFKEIGVTGTVETDKYSVKDIEYDERGNIRKLKRNGLGDPCVEQYDLCGRKKYAYRQIDDLTYQYDEVDRNLLVGIAEASDYDHGYRQSHTASGGIGYDDNGNITGHLKREIIYILYNYLNQPVEIGTSKGTFKYTYDAFGNRLKTEMPREDGTGPAIRIDYVGPFELIDKSPVYTYFSDGRITTTEDGPQTEYFIHDHLGNLRVSFADRNGNGFIDIQQCPDEDSEILQVNHYYPFGMRFEQPYSQIIGGENPYQYNGIERFELGLTDINHTLYRTLDPAIGRWWQVDPKAEGMVDHTPFNSMGNNPAAFSDPEGDFITWNIGNGGLSIGVNFTPIGIPLGGGVNFGFSNGGSIGVYGEIGYRTGGTGVTANFSLDYSFRNNAWYGSAGFAAYGSMGVVNAGANISTNGWGVNIGVGMGNMQEGAGLGIGYGSGGWTFGLGGYYDSFYEPPKSINLSRGGVQSLEDEDILPDGRMLWELSDEEFSMFHTAEGRRALFGGDFDIQLNLAERAYWYGKQLGLAMPTAKVSGFGKTMFNSKMLGYRSKLFGRYHKDYLPDGVKGVFNKGNVRTGWNVHNGSHVFRTAWGPPRTNHIDWFFGPKF